MPEVTSSLFIPSIVRIQLVNLNGVPVPLANLLLSVHVFANTKNDFVLQPFVTDGDGCGTIKKEDIMSEAEAHYDPGLMDYVSIESAKPEVEIAAMDTPQIDRILRSRMTVWKTLLSGESRRWASINELLNVSRGSTNGKVTDGSISACWDQERPSVEYSLQIEFR